MKHMQVELRSYGTHGAEDYEQLRVDGKVVLASASFDVPGAADQRAPYVDVEAMTDLGFDAALWSKDAEVLRFTLHRVMQLLQAKMEELVREHHVAVRVNEHDIQRFVRAPETRDSIEIYLAEIFPPTRG